MSFDFFFLCILGHLFTINLQMAQYSDNKDTKTLADEEDIDEDYDNESKDDEFDDDCCINDLLAERVQWQVAEREVTKIIGGVSVISEGHTNRADLLNERVDLPNERAERPSETAGCFFDYISQSSCHSLNTVRF